MRRSSSRLARGLSSTPRTTLKMAALAPIPRASVVTTVSASPLARSRDRNAYFRSVKVCMSYLLYLLSIQGGSNRQGDEGIRGYRIIAVPAVDPIHETVNAVYVAESRRVLATLIRLLGDFEAAEEALHDAFRAALEQWPRDGVPGNPRAWLVSAGRFKAIDAMGRAARVRPP